MVRLITYLVLIFNLLLALAAALAMVVRTPGSEWPALPALGAIACLCGVMVLGILLKGLRLPDLRHIGTRTTVGSRPLPSLPELDTRRAAAQSAYDAEKKRYNDALARWRAVKDVADGLSDPAFEEARKAYKATQDRMRAAREEVIYAIGQLRRGESRQQSEPFPLNK